MARWAAGSRTLVEPFAGGAGVALRCVISGAVERAVLVERDPGVAAFWKTVMGGAQTGFNHLCDLVASRVEPTRAWFARFAASVGQDSPAWLRGALALVRSRFAWGGVQHPRAGLTSDVGLAERWKPAILLRRMLAIRSERRRFTVIEGDGVQVIGEWSADEEAFFFVDVPYSYGGTAPGGRLYGHSDLDHDALLAAVAAVRGRAVLTYDLTEDTVALAARHGLPTRLLPMRDGRHRLREELLLVKGNLSGD